MRATTLGTTNSGATNPGVNKTGVTKTVPPPSARFVARQAILTKDEKVFGYELLFRDGVESYFCPADPETASRSTLGSSPAQGIGRLLRWPPSVHQLHARHVTERLRNPVALR